jgi:hypothetical protein
MTGLRGRLRAGLLKGAGGADELICAGLQEVRRAYLREDCRFR